MFIDNSSVKKHKQSSRNVFDMDHSYINLIDSMETSGKKCSMNNKRKTPASVNGLPPKKKRYVLQEAESSIIIMVKDRNKIIYICGFLFSA